MKRQSVLHRIQVNQKCQHFNTLIYFLKDKETHLYQGLAPIRIESDDRIPVDKASVVFILSGKVILQADQTFFGKKHFLEGDIIFTDSFPSWMQQLILRSIEGEILVFKGLEAETLKKQKESVTMFILEKLQQNFPKLKFLSLNYKKGIASRLLIRKFKKDHSIQLKYPPDLLLVVAGNAMISNLRPGLIRCAPFFLGLQPIYFKNLSIKVTSDELIVIQIKNQEFKSFKEEILKDLVDRHLIWFKHLSLRCSPKAVLNSQRQQGVSGLQGQVLRHELIKQVRINQQKRSQQLPVGQFLFQNKSIQGQALKQIQLQKRKSNMTKIRSLSQFCQKMFVNKKDKLPHLFNPSQKKDII